jgi:hypothetical protein
MVRASRDTSQRIEHDAMAREAVRRAHTRLAVGRCDITPAVLQRAGE